MSVTLGAAAVTAMLDPILIFGLHLGLDGAAITAVVSRTVMASVALWSVLGKHQLLGRFERDRLADDARLLISVAGPAVLTNLATPVAAAFVTHSIAQFGPSAVAGTATIDRVSPVAFGLIYALSGAAGPILAQNLGAGKFARVREGMRSSLIFMTVAVSVAWLVLALTQGLLIRAFSAEGVAAELISLFCSYIAGSFLFVGALFVANAAFNNLGYPILSTAFNWGRAILGTIPFVWWGSHYGPAGVLIGQAAGASIFGLMAIVVAWRITGQLSQRQNEAPTVLDAPVAAQSAHTATAAMLTPDKP